MTDAATPQPPVIGRRTLTPFGYAVCVAVPILIAAIGFTILYVGYDKEDLVAGDRVELLTSDWEPGAGGDAAQLSGELTLEDGCVLVGGAAVVWPRDYVASVETLDGRELLRVYDPDRDVVARGGDDVELGGGNQDVGDYAGRACAPDSGTIFLVQSDVTVVRGS